MRGVIRPIDFAKLDFSSTLRRAYKELLTFYDASYILVAKSGEAILVTEDEVLRKAASKFVNTITYADLESRLVQE